MSEEPHSSSPLSQSFSGSSYSASHPGSREADDSTHLLNYQEQSHHAGLSGLFGKQGSKLRHSQSLYVSHGVYDRSEVPSEEILSPLPTSPHNERLRGTWSLFHKGR